MVPMMGHKVAMNPAFFTNENIGIAYGMGITAEKVAERWKVSRDGGHFDYMIGATISARAVTHASARALAYANTHRNALFAAETGSRL